MKSFVISENRDSYLGMKLAGIEGAYVRDQETIDEGHTAVRFVTSWAMTDAMVDSFIEDFDRLCHE